MLWNCLVDKTKVEFQGKPLKSHFLGQNIYVSRLRMETLVEQWFLPLFGLGTSVVVVEQWK